MDHYHSNATAIGCLTEIMSDASGLYGFAAVGVESLFFPYLSNLRYCHDNGQ